MLVTKKKKDKSIQPPQLVLDGVALARVHSYKYLYINDVPTVISAESEVNMFADDVALYRIIKSSTDYSHLQNDINSISVCIKQKHLQFNTNKCKLMLLTKKKG